MKLLNKKIILLLSTSFLLTACQLNNSKADNQENPATNQNVNIRKNDYVREDGQVSFKDGLTLLNLDKKMKEKVYKDLDQIVKYTGKTTINPLKMSNLSKIAKQSDYEAIIEDSKQNKQLIYVGFDVCPFCRVFLPKLNQLAKEMNLDYHYYNINERVEDDNFLDVVDNFFKISTVPQLLIVNDGKVDSKLENTDSMADLEKFLLQFDK
ncbi:thioredoxin family protein [Facklamia sp. 7083-14-GEN3]|uniref:thioredoxin family protein n=1 Tax=Facklamia sp. 7083-14-GEN3 TaxID=2973478 RepID=UPI00215C3AB7|nr:thioredoxin family protein [Facklamia sp. 7083-14-GEN3]MCR8969818.1 thioredoxin family protein [Facklamia sp. 7083-14-GEN3]